MSPIQVGSAVLSPVVRDGLFLGFGDVSIDGRPMRSPQRAAFVEIRTPDAVRLLNYRHLETLPNGTGHTLRFTADRVDDGWMEYMLHTVRSRYRAGDWSEGPGASDVTLELDLQPVERHFGHEVARGYAYRYRYTSPTLPIYRILDRATWEPGGNAGGLEFWLRNGTSPSIWEIESPDQALSTEWYLPPIEQPNIFQFLPFQAQLPGFTLTAHPEGALITLAREVAHIRSLFEKPRGQSQIVHLHEHCADLSLEFTTSWMEVLWIEGGVASRTDGFNRWESIREVVWTELNAQVDFAVETVAPYGVMEEWSLPDFDKYTSHGLPKLLDAGCTTIMIPSEHANNMNTWGSSNMCCVVDWQIAETVGEDRLGRFCRTAQAGGAWVEMWGNTALSSLQFIFDINWQHDNGPSATDRVKFLPREGTVWEVLAKLKRPWVRNPAGHIEADHYAPVFCQVNFLEPLVQAHWHATWGHLKAKVGIGGMFLDSSFNMSADKFYWCQNDTFDRAGGATIDQTELLGSTRPATAPPAAIRTQYHAYLQTLAQMRRNGFHLSVEDTGAFGVSRSGPGLADRLSSLPMWLDCLCVFDVDALQNQDAQDVFFRGLAYRNMWYLYWNPADDAISWRQGNSDARYQPTDWQLVRLRAYGRARPYFGRRTIWPEEAAIEYRTEGHRLLWTRAETVLEYEQPTEVWDLVEDLRKTGPRHTLSAHGVYLVS